MAGSWGGLPYDGLPDGAYLQAGGTAYFWLGIPARTVYIGEAVPVEIEVGIRQGLPATLKGLPLLKGGDFTLNKLDKRADTRKTYIQGRFFDVLSWHTALAAVKPGEFSLSAGMPLSVKTGTSRTAARDIVIESAPLRVHVLALPVDGRPRAFSGAVGDFQISSDISAVSVKQGEPLTLRLHVRGTGNFARVAPTMFDHLEHWKTYPAKSVFTPRDAVGNRGEEVIEQSLIATEPGEQWIPGIDFSYFNPGKRRYEHTQTRPIRVSVVASLRARAPIRAASQVAVAAASAATVLPGLRPDHRRPVATHGELRPLYFHGPFLALCTALTLLLSAAWIGARPNPARTSSKATARALARLKLAAQAGDSLPFFELARKTLLQTFAARWQMSAEEITGAELRARLGLAGENIERLFAAEDETRYAGGASPGTDLQYWLSIIRGQLAVGSR
ncbi:MAG TPA: BatD family protein [Steroidobacteraceae bacterium]|jgi:hypothetical protein|nr:BatD family protein [Steroidobacteraceae bacterium]